LNKINYKVEYLIFTCNEFHSGQSIQFLAHSSFLSYLRAIMYKAYAKINLGLRIVGKRIDGFHDLETIFHRINLFDEILLNPTQKDIFLSCSNSTIPADKNNLCWKAVHLLQNELGTSLGAEIVLKKNIPVGAGLGGGSSDAATVLRELPKLWGTEISNEDLHRLALQLGSDVPYFLLNSTAYAEGRGEKLTPIDFRLPSWIVLVNPNIHVSTPWAYNQLSTYRGDSFPIRDRMWNQIGQDSTDFSLILQNDFEEIVIKKHSAIGKIKNHLLENGAQYAVMSGSGSSVFGLFEQQEHAQLAYNYFKQKYFVHLTEPNFSPY
jgi:4-diphosphocytidyl-2-C-methyl-D-erythritol kinase